MAKAARKTPRVVRPKLGRDGPRFPLILFGSEYWKGLIRWMKDRLEADRYISPGDLDLYTLTDDPQEAVDIILDYKNRVGPPEVMPKAFA